MFKVTLHAAALLAVALAGSSTAVQSAGSPAVLSTPTVQVAAQSDVSLPLRDIIASQQYAPTQAMRATPSNPVLRPKLQLHRGLGAQASTFADPAVQSAVNSLAAATVGVNVLGVGVGFNGYTVPDAPTDANLAVGDTQVVQWVNVSFAIFNKTTGATLAGPTLGNAFWAGFGGACEANNSGDMTAQWDKVAHRWVMYQPSFSSPYGHCFAISTSPDALGTYYRYFFVETGGFPDYPKLGIWTNGYYQANNLFNTAGTAYLGAKPCVYERDKMLAGQAAQQVCFLDNSGGTLFDDSMLPADIDSENALPLPGQDELFLGSIDNFSTGTNIYKYIFHVDWNNTANSFFSGVNGTNPVAVATYLGSCSFGSTACVPQKGTTSKLQSLGDRLMYRLAYRRPAPPANYQSWLVSHSVVAGSSVGQRWYEFRAPLFFANNLPLPNNSPPLGFYVYQQGTYAPDSTYRWMGSIAMDKNGNILMGYSRSSLDLYPDIYAAGRAASDPLGTLGTEVAIVDQTVATGSQRSTGNRWGDYTSMAIDNDGCTFWYTNQYYTVPNSTFAWSTRVASLKFPDCSP